MTQPTASGSDQFDPATFTVVEPRTFEDLKVGDIFRAPSRTLTDAHATAFQTVSAVNHPIHYNVEYARGHGHTAPVVHVTIPIHCRLLEAYPVTGLPNLSRLRRSV